MTYDSIIIGAGAAGLACALLLGRRQKVALVTHRAIGSSKPCGGLLGPEAAEFVRRLNTPGDFFCDPATVETNLVLGQFSLHETFGNIHRGRLEQELAAALVPQTDVLLVRDTAYRRTTSGFVVTDTATGREYGCRTLIAADGVRSSTRRKFGYPAATTRVMEQVSLAQRLEEAHLVFDPAVTPRDYYWIIPKDDETLLGYPLLDRDAVEADVGRRFAGLRLGTPMRRERYPLTRLASTAEIELGDDGLFFVGEAAGLVMPLTGDGLTGAFESACTLAEVLGDSVGAQNDAYRDALAARVEKMGREIVPGR